MFFIQCLIISICAIWASSFAPWGGYIFKYLFQRPFIGGLVCGIVFGDITQGVIIGCAMQLVYIGYFQVGGIGAYDMGIIAWPYGSDHDILYPAQVKEHEMDKQKVVIIGAGRTGRGMLGELFANAGGYALTFADNDSRLVEGLRRQGYYTVEQKGLLSGDVKHTVVRDFTVLDTAKDHDAYIAAVANADYVMTALFPEAFDQVAGELAEAVEHRVAHGITSPAAFMLGANFVGLREYYYPRITKALDAAGRDHFERLISLVGTNANRKVVFPAHYDADRYFLTGDDKPVLMVDNGFRAVPDGKLPAFFKLTDNLEMYMVEKIWTANLDHCSFGFLGNYYGYSTINQAVRDDNIRRHAYYAWLEGRRAVEAEYGLSIPAHEAKLEEYRKFASPYFADAIARIGRDPIRKLGKNDRFIGPALLCLKHGITPWYITRCASYGFFYQNRADASSETLRAMVAARGIEATIASVCGLDPEVPHPGLSPGADG